MAIESQYILRKKWLLFAFLSALFLAAGYIGLRAWWNTTYALRWLGLSSPVVGYLLIVLWRSLPYNYRQGDSEYLLTLGWGNQMTLLRGLFVAGLTGFLFSPHPSGWMAWIPGTLYILSDAADFLDGYLARRTNHVTRLGEILDMRFDGVGVFVAVSLVVYYGQAPLWILSAALARYIFLAGLWLRKKRNLTIFDLPPSVSRRGFAGLQMGFLAVALLPIFSPPGIHIAASLFTLPFLGGFLYDWLIVSGVVSSKPSSNTSALTTYLKKWAPFIIRLAIIGIHIILFEKSVLTPSHPDSLVLNSLEILIAGLLLMGIAGRISAIAGLLVLGFHQIQAPLSILQITLAVAYTTILFAGTGTLSIWKPEDTLIYKRAGENRLPLTQGSK